MSKFKIISKDSQSVRHEGAPQYNGAYLGVDYIEFRSISSPSIINWEIGDYVDYFRTGKRYKLYTLPMPKKVARVGSYGGAIEYSNVQFFSATKELEIAPFKDLVADDNGIHFSTRPDVSTFEDVRGIARRIEDCMNDIFPDRWKINVYESDDEDLNALLLEKKQFSISQGSCLDALSQIYDTWKGVGWIHTTENGHEVITIGRANVRDSGNTTENFTYGIGKGLTSIKKASANDGEFATRLYVYGSNRNLPPRYYNKFDIVNAESADIQNLMIPIGEWGLTDGIPDPSKAYLQADDALIEKYGLIPKTVYFDGSEHEEIYPSIKGLTRLQVREAMIAAGEGDSEYLPRTQGSEDNYRIDEVGLVNELDLDEGTRDDYEKEPNINIHLREMGFNIAEQGKLTAEGYAVISMRSGKCEGREFRVRKYIGPSYGDALYGERVYNIEKAWDDSLGMSFPNRIFPIETGDQFVLLDIPMPDFYVTLNAEKLLERGRQLLADYTRVSAFYEPGVNAIRMKNIGSIITPGMFMQIEDADIIDTDNHKDYVLIDSVSIDENSDIPTYRITLRDQKRAARTYSVLEEMIEDAKEDANQAIKRERQYTERRFRSSQETLKMLESAFTNFSKGISPATVKTMALLIGDESLQYKFTASTNSLTDVPCPLSWSQDTRQMIGVPASLVHMTLDVHSIAPLETRRASDYMRWNIKSWYNSSNLTSPFIEDANKSYYVYVIASYDSDDAWYYIDDVYREMNQDFGYFFLVGILNSEYEGNRDFVTLYGFTEVLPGQITTDVIRSADGQTYFDLQRGVISGDIHFTAPDGENTSLKDYAESREYLKDAFKEGSTIVSGGVVMSEMVAVINAEEEVEAFLNGSTKFRDDKKGKLILAAGIPEESSSKSEKLADRVPESKTKIYENGRIETNDIHAEGGLFENVKVLGSSRSPFMEGAYYNIELETEDNHYNYSTNSANQATLKKDISQSGRIMTFSGSFWIRCVNGYIYDRGKSYYNTSMGVGSWSVSQLHGYEGVGDEFIRLMAVPITSSEVAWVVIERRPIDSQYSDVRYTGQFAGLRPRTRMIKSSSTLSVLDHTIMVNASSAITITLPSNPEAGQELDIYFANQTEISYPFKSNDILINFPTVGVWNAQQTNVTGKGMVRVMCIEESDGTKRWWIYRFL